jgi:CheY-like chemotaxis protein
MNGKEQKVLAAGIDRSAFEELAPVMRRDAVQVDWVATPEEGVKLATEQKFDVVILDAEPPDWSLERVVRELRRGGSPSRSAAVMVLAEPDQVDAARALRAKGVNRVMLISDPPQMICDQMAGLLEVAPRVALRLPMNLQTALGNRGREIFCQTVNLSATGMLVRTQARPQLGTPVVFRLHLSEKLGSVMGRGEMVRHATRSQCGIDGVGVRFKGFAGDGAVRLQTYLNELAGQSLPASAPAMATEVDVLIEPAGGPVPEFDPLDDEDIAAFLD